MIGMADKSSSGETVPPDPPARPGGTGPAVPTANAGLGAVQQTLFIPLAARDRESRKKRPLLRDPKAAEIVASVDFDAAKYGRGWGGFITVPRTAIFDAWVSDFLTEHPAGTVIEIGTGLNTRFERVDNGRVHWIDLDLPDTIELRRKFFADSGRRRMVAASALEEHWLATVQDSPGPYFFVADGVLVYLAQAPQVITHIAGRFPGALIAFDTYTQRALEQQHRMAAKKNIDARWAWSCDDPRSLESLGLEVMEVVAVTRPPHALRTQWPLRHRLLLALASRIAGDIVAVTLFRSPSR
jgi:O-methyltransferase involved in polyketide biosynthesis